MGSESPLQFPCDMPIKVFGRSAEGFKANVLAIVRAHRPTLADEDVRQRTSRGGSYVSLTVNVRVESRAQADALYRDLTAADDVLMVL